MPSTWRLYDWEKPRADVGVSERGGGGVPGKGTLRCQQELLILLQGQLGVFLWPRLEDFTNQLPSARHLLPRSAPSRW